MQPEFSHREFEAGSTPSLPLHSEKEIVKPAIRDLLVCFALANLSLLAAWRAVLDCKVYVAALEFSHFLAVMADSVVLCAFFYCGILVARRLGTLGNLLAKWAFLQISFFYLSNLLMPFVPPDFVQLTRVAQLLFPIVFFLAAPKFPRWTATFLLLLTPCVAYLFLRSAWDMSHLPHPRVVRGSFQRLSTEGPRVLCLVFDELGEYTAFTHRPAGVEMPAFDRLRGEAVVATTAYPAAAGTIVAMPAFITGHAIREVRVDSEHDLRVHYLKNAGNLSAFEPLETASTVFSDVHALGMGTAMIGWYHPYCSVLSNLDFCAHTKAGVAIEGIYEGRGIAANMVDFMVQSIPFAKDTKWAIKRRDECYRETHNLENSFLEDTTRDAVANFRSGLMIVHLPIPHPPDVDGSGMYFGNLAASDRELAEIRSTMEKAGTWDSTAVVITSDHWWRAQMWTFLSMWTDPERAYLNADQDPRVPFIVKLPNEHTSATYTSDFNVLITRPLINGLMTQKITTAAALKRWLDTHREDEPPLAFRWAIIPGGFGCPVGANWCSNRNQ